MKVVVVGPGALGCLLAAKLSLAHNDVWLLDHDAGRAESLAASGVFLEEDGQLLPCPIRATADAGLIGATELLLLCVKSHQLEAALVTAAPVLRQVGLLLALANGIGHLEVLTEHCRGCFWGIGVTAQGATLAGMGRVIHRGEGLTKIGLPPARGAEPSTPSQQKLLTAAAATLTQAGIPTMVVDQVLPHLWGKLLVNVGINALTAINDCPNGALLDSPGLVQLMTAAVQEAAQVAESLGIDMPGDPVTVVKDVCRATAANLSSMLQDVRAGRRTEIESINGAVVKLADALGLPVPVNRELVGRVRELEEIRRL